MVLLLKEGIEMTLHLSITIDKDKLIFN